jgi:hypothetical protein
LYRQKKTKKKSAKKKKERSRLGLEFRIQYDEENKHFFISSSNQRIYKSVFVQETFGKKKSALHSLKEQTTINHAKKVFLDNEKDCIAADLSSLANLDKDERCDGNGN